MANDTFSKLLLLYVKVNDSHAGANDPQRTICYFTSDCPRIESAMWVCKYEGDVAFTLNASG